MSEENKEDEFLQFDELDPSEQFKIQEGTKYSVQGIEFELKTQAQIAAWGDICNTGKFIAMEGERHAIVNIELDYSMQIRTILKSLGYDVRFSYKTVKVLGIKNEKHHQFINTLKDCFRGINLTDSFRSEP